MGDAIGIADRMAVKSQRLGALMNVAESLAMQGKTLEAMKIVKEHFEATERKFRLGQSCRCCSAVKRA